MVPRVRDQQARSSIHVRFPIMYRVYPGPRRIRVVLRVDFLPRRGQRQTSMEIRPQMLYRARVPAHEPRWSCPAYHPKRQPAAGTRKHLRDDMPLIRACALPGIDSAKDPSTEIQGDRQGDAPGLTSQILAPRKRALCCGICLYSYSTSVFLRQNPPVVFLILWSTLELASENREFTVFQDSLIHLRRE